jgi:hypothetical protein
MERSPLKRDETEMCITLDLFAWRGGEIVLLGELADGQWRLARGWRSADCLTDIRRWSFDAAERFVRQVKRLVLETGAEQFLADRAAEAASEWITLRAGDYPVLS